MAKEKKTKVKHKLSKTMPLTDLLDALYYSAHEDILIVKNNFNLFLGLGISICAFLNFSSGRYCEGNPATHFSCTHPATYYFYETNTIFLFVLGIFLITLWHLKRVR